MSGIGSATFVQFVRLRAAEVLNSYIVAVVVNRRGVGFIPVVRRTLVNIRTDTGRGANGDLLICKLCR